MSRPQDFRVATVAVFLFPVQRLALLVGQRVWLPSPWLPSLLPSYGPSLPAS